MSGKLMEITGRVRVRSQVFLEICETECYFLTGSDDGMVRHYCRIGNEFKAVEDVMKTANNQAIAAMAVSDDGEWIVSSGKGVVDVWKRREKKVHYTVSEHSDWVDTVHISPDSTKLATGSNDKKAFVWDLSTRKRLVGPLEHPDRVASVRFSPDGGRIVTCTANSLRIYNLNVHCTQHNGESLKTIPTSVTLYPNPIAWSSASNLFALVSHNTLMHINVDTEQTLSSWTIPGESVKGGFGSIALSSNRRFIAAFVGRAISLWDASTSARISSDIVHPALICSIALSAKSNYLAISDASGKTTICDLKHSIANYYLVDQDRATSTKGDGAQLQYEMLRRKLDALELRLEELSVSTANTLPQAAEHIPLRISNGVYRIKSITGDLFIARSPDGAGTVVVQPLDKTNAQLGQWTVSLSADGAYDIMGRVDDSNVPLSTGGANALLCGQGCMHTAWTIEPRGLSYVIGNTADATAIHLNECHQCVSVALRDNTQNQRWVFERVAV